MVTKCDLKQTYMMILKLEDTNCDFQFHLEDVNCDLKFLIQHMLSQIVISRY
jgi:hypothetical protein